MKRSLAAIALLVAGLVTGPVAALAHDEYYAAPQPAPGYGYGHPSPPGYGESHRPTYQDRHHPFVGRRFSGHPMAARRLWVEPTWAWNGWRWVGVPGYWSR